MRRLFITLFVFLIPTFCFGATVVTNSGTTVVSGWGGSSGTGARFWVGQPFTLPVGGSITNISICNAYTSTASSNNVSVIIDLEADSGGSPSGVSLATVTKIYNTWPLYPSPGGGYGGGAFTIPYVATAGSYWIVMHPDKQLGGVTTFVTCGAGSPSQEQVADSPGSPSWGLSGGGQDGMTVTYTPNLFFQELQLFNFTW